MMSFPEHFPPDHVAKLKGNHFYGGLSKWLKAMVAYLKACTNEKAYSDYLWAAREAEKEEVIEPSCSQTADNTSKPKATSFFPLPLLKGTQPTRTPAVWVAHLEEEGANMKEVLRVKTPMALRVWLRSLWYTSLGSERCSAGEMLLPLQQPRILYSWMPIGKGIKNSHPFKLKGGDGTREGSPDPFSQGDQVEDAPGWDAQAIGHQTQIPFLNPNPFHWWYGIKNVARVRINGESCMALLDKGAQIKHYHAGFCWESFFWGRTPVRPSRQMSHLSRPGECTDLTFGLHCHMGSSGWSPGLGQTPNSPGDPRIVKFNGMGTHHSGNPCDKLHDKHDKGERERWSGNTLGKCPMAYLLAVWQATATVKKKYAFIYYLSLKAVYNS